MEADVGPLEIQTIDLLEDDYDGCSENRVKGLVIHVEKCTNPEHDNWIHIHSDNKSEYVSDTHTEIVTGTDLKTTVGRDRQETVLGNMTASIGGDSAESVTGDRDKSIGGNDNSTIGGNRVDTTVGNYSSSVGGDRTEEIAGKYLVAAGEIDLNSELVQIKRLVAAPATMTEAIADGKYDLCRVVAWLENWTSGINSRLDGLAQRVSALEPPA